MVRHALMLLIVVFAAFAASPARACSCMEISPEQAFGYADRVFAGIVVAQQQYSSKNESAGTRLPVFRDGVEFTFAVTNVWKGAVEETIRVRSSGFGGACGYEFATGTHYLVYAHATKDGALGSGLCSGNGPVDLAIWDRYWLPKARVVDAKHAVRSISTSELIGLLGSEDLNQSFPASRALGGTPKAREEVLPILRGIMRGTRPGNPANAARAIGQMGEGGREAEPDLTWLLGHGSGKARAAALEALIRLGDPALTNRSILKGLSDPTWECLLAACSESTRLAHADSIAFARPAAARLRKLVRHPHFEVRAHAIFALEEFPATGIALLPELETISQADTSDYVRYAARLTTLRLSGRQLPYR